MSGHHFFCAEWRRYRQVFPIEEDLLYELVFAAPSWDYVPLDAGAEFVQTNQLQGWVVEVEQELFTQIHEAFESNGPRSARGRSTIRERSPTWRRTSPGSPRRCRSPSPGRVTRSPTVRSIPPVSQSPTRLMLCKNPTHPLANVPEVLGRTEFVTEMRKRLHVPGLFTVGENSGGAGGQVQGEPLFSVEECEDLFDVLLQLQKIAGVSPPASSNGHVLLGQRMDETVDTFYGIVALRFAIERAAPSLNAFLASLAAKDSQLVDATLLRQFLVMVNYRLESQNDAADLLPLELIVKAHSGVDISEFRRHLSFAAPVGVSLNEVQSHLEVKHGYGRAKLPGFLDCAQLAEHFCEVEHLDISPLDLARFFRIWGGVTGAQLNPIHLEEQLLHLPLEADWGLEPFAVEQTFNALGIRALQLERHKKKDAYLPPQAILELLRNEGDTDKAEVILPSEPVLRERFEALWNHCVGDRMWLAVGSSSSWEKEKFEDRPENEKPREGSKEASKDAKVPETQRKEKELAASIKMKEVCEERYLASVWQLALQPVTRRQYDSIFPNVSDILAVSNVNLRSGQVVVVRYRLAGACNFWHPKHRVLKDEREPLPWPVPSKVLGETPFVALVPRGLRWTNAGGGGFYSGSQAFNQVDPGLRADLPLDRDGKLLLYGTVEFVAPYLLRGLRRNASSATEELEFRLFSSRKNRIIGCVGEPLRVQVSHQALPPAVATLQVCCEGRSAKLRWAGYDSHEAPVQVQALRLNVRTDRKEMLVELDPETKQYEMTGLLPDTDYEFHLRLESRGGAGREATCRCRTNSRCSQPLSVTSAGASTTYVDLQWRAPEVVGNERTQDRWQLHGEKILRYEAQLSIAEAAAVERKSLLKSRTSVGALREPLGGASAVPTSCRPCSWEVSSSVGPLSGRLQGLRPDTLYLLANFSAVNSMGPGTAARELQFWTMPLHPVIEGIRVRQGLVILTLLETGGQNVNDLETVVRLESNQKEQSFPLPKSALRGEKLQELPLDFQKMPMSSQRSGDDVHNIKIRARNPGGWSTWSEEMSTSAIARQQGADYAQQTLEQAMQRRAPEKLAQVLKDVRDIEFEDKSLVSQATELLEILQKVQMEVEEAMAARDPDTLRHALRNANEVSLPGIEEAQDLLNTLDRVCHNLDTARGIDALRAALREGHEARLPAALLQRAVQRLGTREAAQQGLEMAIEAARVPVVTAALETAMDMHLPSEEKARRLLAAISHSEKLLQAALLSESICDLENALDSAANSGLREDELMLRAQKLLAAQLQIRQNAEKQLEDAIEARQPSMLRDALEVSARSQVDRAQIEEAAELLKHLEFLLEKLQAAVGLEERATTLQAAVQGKVPRVLMAAAEKQLNCLNELHRVLAAGDVPATRRALKLAEVAGVKDQELAEAHEVQGRWERLTRELEIAVSMGATQRLLLALENTVDSGISEEQLRPARTLLGAFQRSDAAFMDLEEAIETCDAEIIHKSLVDACNNNVSDSELIFSAREMLDNVLFLRQQLLKAVESMDLQRVHAAVEAAQADDSLPEKDLSNALHILEELKAGELARLERHLKQAADSSDFRALDNLLQRADSAKELGVQVEELDLDHYRHLAQKHQVTNIRMLQEDLQRYRLSTDWPAVLDRPEDEEEVPPPEVVEVVPLPSVVVAGQVQLDLYPRGIRKEFLTLPREIVEAKIKIALPDRVSDDVEPVMEARARLEELTNSIQSMLTSEDELRRIGSMEIQDDGAYRHVTQNMALYLSASTSSREIIEAFFEVPEEATPTEMEMETAGGSAPSRVLSRSKSFNNSTSKRRAVKGLWQCLRRLGHTRPEVNSHCLHNVRGRVLRRITTELFWAQPATYRETMDATCVAMTADGLVEVVNARGVHGAYYGVDQSSYRVQSKGVDALFGAVSHLGTERVEGSDMQGSLDGKMLCKQMMQVRLDLLPERVTDLFFVLAATNSRELGKFTQLGFRIADSDIGATLAVEEEQRSQLTFEAVVIMCAIYKLGDGYWRIGSMNVSCSGSPRDLKAALSKLEQLGFPRKHETSSQEHLVVESVRRYLEQPRSSVKAASVNVDSSNTMTIQYAIEVLETDGADANSKGEELKERLGHGFQDALLEEMFKFTNEKVKPERLRVLPVITKSLSHVFIEVRWEFGEVKRTDHKDHSYLDGALITFAGRSLQEIVDYRGPHGVRIVHNGIVDYNGMWVGPVGTSDAADGAIKYGGLLLDELHRTGKSVFEVHLDRLPPATTDVYVVVSSPSGRELSKYSNVVVAIVDAWKSHKVSACLLKSKPASQGVIFCRLSKSSRGWRLGAFRSPSSGGCHNFHPLIESLRDIQAQTYPDDVEISLGGTLLRGERRLLPLKQLRAKGQDLQRQCSTGSITSLLTWSPARNPNSRRFGASDMD